MKLNRFLAVKYSLEKVNLYTMKLSEKGSTGRIKTAQIATGQNYLKLPKSQLVYYLPVK
jgi:hypothetical protein